MEESKGIPWCSTKTDRNGRHAKYWGSCNEHCQFDCKTIRGKNCIFPFIYKGIEYKQCTKIDNAGVAWCSTHIDRSGVTKYSGNCEESCPGAAEKGNFCNFSIQCHTTP